MTRLRFFLILLTVITVAAFGNWLLSSLEQINQIGEQAPRHEPDYFLEQLKATVFKADGEPHYRLHAARLAHYADDDSVALQTPTLQLYRETQLAWQLDADEGLIFDKGRLIHFNGEVDINQTTDTETALRLKTRDLRIYTEYDYAETDAPVKITRGAQLTTATGMRADLAAGRLELLADIRGKYEARRP